MNINESADIYGPACAAIYGTSNKFEKMKLDKLLGVIEFTEYIVRNTRLDQPMPRWLKDLCVALTGPHGPTVLKVYQIQKGLPHDKEAFAHLKLKGGKFEKAETTE